MIKYLDSRAKHPVAARHEISLLGHVFATAIRWGAATVNPVRTLERTPKGKRTRYVTDAEYDAVHALANERMRIAMDLALLTGQRRADLLALTRTQLTDGGIVFRQSKTGVGVLVEWTDELRRITDRAKALKPQVPGEYLLRKRNGRPYTAWGFSAIWQRLMDKATAPGGARARRAVHVPRLESEVRQRQGRVGERRGALGSRELADSEVCLSSQDAASDTASLKNI
jgi:integrase